MISIINEQFASIPVLHVVKQSNMSQKLPTVFFLHGFTSAKEHNLHVAYLLAQKGFRVILPDALYHGEREEKMEKREQSFWEIVLRSIAELDDMKQELTRLGLINERRLGLIGTSMGAITMFGALTQYKWVHTAVSFMGAGYYEEFAEGQLQMMKKKGIIIEKSEEIIAEINRFDLSKQLHKMDSRPLFIWHGESDRVVPYAFSQKLYEQLQPFYVENKNDLRLMSEKNVDHKVTRKAVLQAVDWFQQYLNV